MPFDLTSLHNTIWLAEPGAIRQALARLKMYPTCPTARELAEARRDRLAEAGKAAGKAKDGAKGKVGVIGVHGPISQRMDAMLWKLSGTSTEEVGAAFDALMGDARVSTIVLHIDSPGGSSYGVQELADKIREGRDRKRVVAVADSLAASAAYWIASAAGEVVVTPGGDVGSIGVYALHTDESGALEKEGVRVTLVTAGKYKAEFSPHAPLSEEARAHLQDSVNETYAAFLKGVAAGREVSVDEVRVRYGQGRVLSADRAKAVGMVDRVQPFGQAMEWVQSGGSPEMLKLRSEHERAKQEARRLHLEYLRSDRRRRIFGDGT
jgi:signal peptide peptidase SppA